MSKARIVEKYIIRTAMKTLAPIRIASGQEDGVTDILILKNKQNEAFIPGTSLAGVLRASISDIYGEEAAGQLFGSIKDNENSDEQSMLNISDIVLSGSEIIYRDGVAIDTYRGVGKDGSKYDFEMLDRGSEGELLIEITVRQADNEKPMNTGFIHSGYETSGAIYKDMAATIADLLTSGVNVGSLTTKGFGLVASKEPAEVVCFDFKGGGGFESWLDYLKHGKITEAEYVGNPLSLTSAAYSTIKVEAAFDLRSSLIIRDYDAAEERNDSLSKDDNKKLSSVQMMSGDSFVIPGTSIKGVLRNRAKKILMTLSGAHNTATDSFLNSLMGFSDKKASSKSRLSVEEVYIAGDALTKHRHSRNRIDRFTGSTVDGALFTEEPVWQQQKGSAPVRLSMTIRNASKAEAGLLLLLVKDLWLGSLAIGGGKSVGRGTLRGRTCKISFEGKEFAINESAGFAVEGDRAELESYVAALIEAAKEMAVKE